MDNLVYLFNFMICAQIFVVRMLSKRCIGQRLFGTGEFNSEPGTILESL